MELKKQNHLETSITLYLKVMICDLIYLPNSQCEYDVGFFVFFFKVFFVGHIHMSYCGATGTPVLDF